LAKSLTDSIDDSDASRGWSKLKSRATTRKPQVAAAKSSVLELRGLGDDEASQGAEAVQLVGQTMLDHGVSQEEINGSIVTEETTVEEATKGKRKRKATEESSDVIPMPAPSGEYRLPPISREQLAAMFRNLEENGMSLEDFN
jgi:hypothetical protein